MGRGVHAGRCSAHQGSEGERPPIFDEHEHFAPAKAGAEAGANGAPLKRASRGRAGAGPEMARITGATFLGRLDRSRDFLRAGAGESPEGKARKGRCRICAVY